MIPGFSQNFNDGSNGSYLPNGIGGPSYFEDQNSIESLNDGVVIQHRSTSNGGGNMIQ